jgi:DinB superfamily
MENFWKSILRRQYEAAIKMLENAIADCPEQIWSDRSHKPEYWYLVYHTLFFLDLYLSGALEGYAPPSPFTLDKLDPAGVLPEWVYTKEELQNFLLHCREKCRAKIENLTDAKAQEICKFSRFEISFGELLLDNMQHVQHHAAQLNLILRQKTDSAPNWVTTTKICE